MSNPSNPIQGRESAHPPTISPRSSQQRTALYVVALALLSAMAFGFSMHALQSHEMSSFGVELAASLVLGLVALHYGNSSKEDLIMVFHHLRSKLGFISSNQDSP